MLRQHQLIRMQIHQLMDACLFAVSFWLASELRQVPGVVQLLHRNPAPLDDSFFWIFLFLVPASPMLLEWQGFYNRPLIAPRRMILLPLLRACAIATVLLALSLFFLQITFERGVVIFFPLITFALVLLKEEILRWLSSNGASRARR